MTFDADMTPSMLAALHAGRVRSWFDARIVAELRATHTPATVFLTGLWSETYPAVVRALAGDPLFELENHSFDHAAWATPCYGLSAVSSVAAKRAEVTLAARVITRLAGRGPVYFRFPGGCHTGADLTLVRSLGEIPLGWDVVSGDAFQPDASVVVHDVLSRVRPGSIVVLHFIGAPNAPATAAALARIIPVLRARGYRFVTLAQLLTAG